MPERFYFDLANDRETIRDVEGVEADDAPDAIEAACEVIAAMADRVRAVDPTARWTLIVRAADGAIVKRLPVT